MPTRPALRARLALFLVALAALAGCRAPGAGAPPPPLHPKYRPQLEAVQAALEREQLDVAERTLLAWGLRLDADAALAARPAGEGGPAPVPGAPSTADVAGARETLARLEAIVRGRRVLAGLDLQLVLQRVPGAQRVEVLLEASSAYPADVVWRPGPGILDVERVSLEPTSGRESRALEAVPVPDVPELRLARDGRGAVVLAELPIGVPPGAIATRTRCGLVLRGGEVLVDGRTHPARALEVPAAERTDLPSWLPAAPVDPAELARLAQFPEASQAALVERAVRILPERRVEALELLQAPGAARGREDFPPLVPVLRWLAGTTRPNRDVEFWRAYLAEGRWRDAATR